MAMDKLIIFDTTLRDGEQSPGASMSKDEKVRIARQLERLHVDVIEAGFAASSPGDFAAIQAVAAAVKDATICSLARANEYDITQAAKALEGANSKRIHTFIATSALHMEKKLRMTPEQVMEQAIASIRLARQFTDDIEFSPEDGYRSDPEFLPCLRSRDSGRCYNYKRTRHCGLCCAGVIWSVHSRFTAKDS